MTPLYPGKNSCKPVLCVFAACSLLLLLAGWWQITKASTPVAHSQPLLCEVILENGCPEDNNSQLCRALEGEIPCSTFFIVHSRSQYNELTRFRLATLPSVMINRSFFISVADDQNWKSRLLGELRNEAAAEQWALSLYLSARESPDGRQEVDISVCNLETTRSFNGRYAVWLVEKAGRQHQDCPCWSMHSEVAAGRIFELPHDETRGCPMPDHFTLPQDRGGGRFALVAVVFDHAGTVQAVAAQELKPCKTK